MKVRTSTLHLAVFALVACGVALPAAASPCWMPSSPTPISVTYDPVSGVAAASSGTITWACSNGAPQIEIINGNTGSFSRAAWMGGSSTNAIGYNVYLDSGHTQVWGDGTSGTVRYYTPTYSGSVPFYFQVTPALQNASPGTYSDTLTVYLGRNLPAGSAIMVNLPITITVNKSCALSTGNLSFGNYDPLGANIATPLDADTGTSFAVSCTATTQYTVSINTGMNASGGAPNLKETTSGALLPYQIYVDSTRTTPWSGYSFPTTKATSTTPVPVTVYGRIPAALDPSPGSYTDVLTATVSF